jgi:hypothetical protein
MRCREFILALGGAAAGPWRARSRARRSIGWETDPMPAAFWWRDIGSAIGNLADLSPSSQPCMLWADARGARATGIGAKSRAADGRTASCAANRRTACRAADGRSARCAAHRRTACRAADGRSARYTSTCDFTADTPRVIPQFRPRICECGRLRLRSNDTRSASCGRSSSQAPAALARTPRCGWVRPHHPQRCS